MDMQLAQLLAALFLLMCAGSKLMVAYHHRGEDRTHALLFAILFTCFSISVMQ